MLVLNIVLWGCNDGREETVNTDYQLKLEDFQGYWESNDLEYPAKVDKQFNIMEIGLPAPTGMRNSLVHYYKIEGNSIQCYIKCIVDYCLPNETYNPIYTICTKEDYTINLGNDNRATIDIFEGNLEYDIVLDKDQSSIFFLREQQDILGFTHIFFKLNKIGKKEWEKLEDEVITPKDSNYEEAYEKVFMNF